MNKKGFTLVEMLAVFILLSVIIALIFPAVESVLKQSNETISDTQINTILNGTYDYTLKNLNKLPSYNKTIFITLNELKKEGFVDSNIMDVKTREKYPDHLVISVKNVGTNYKKRFDNSMLNGGYLYKIETNILTSEDYESKKPIIEIEGYEESKTKQININTNFEEPSYSATSSSGKDLTNDVIKNVIFQDKNIELVDTSKAGIYYINYTVVDDKGYSDLVTLNVIITDNLPPTLTIPNNTTISTRIDKFDLYDGASCIDNSNECEITIEGEIDFGIPGKYTIEYTANDPSGNSVTDRRIITVE